MNSQRQTDRDSLAALDALLRIRQSDALDSAMANNSVSSTTTNHAPSLSHHSFAARWSSLAARSALMNQQNHHAGIGASPAHYRLAAAQAVAASSWGNGLLATDAPNPSTRRNSLTDALITQSSSTPATSMHHGASGTCTNSTTSSRFLGATLQQQEDMTAAETIKSTKERKVRQEKVEEALRSKPQRGRKREDLSSKERLELTRTRNREHAKSTRIRKKARYQELLDREEKFLQIQEQEKLEIERKGCIQDFFEMRQSMLVDQVQKSMDNKEGPFKSERFSELADDTVCFEFDSLLPGGANADCDDAISKMIEWDKALLTRMMEISSFDRIPAEALRSLAYEIEAGPDGIAMNKNGDAFCRVELYVHDDIVLSSSGAPLAKSQASSPSTRKLVLSGICVFTFGSESRRLTSLKWTTCEDKCSIRLRRSAEGESDSSNSSQPSRETLGSQLVHPSVVSLDHARHIMELDENYGPGMNI